MDAPNKTFTSTLARTSNEITMLMIWKNNNILMERFSQLSTLIQSCLVESICKNNKYTDGYQKIWMSQNACAREWKFLGNKLNLVNGFFFQGSNTKSITLHNEETNSVSKVPSPECSLASYHKVHPIAQQLEAHLLCKKYIVISHFLS